MASAGKYRVNVTQFMVYDRTTGEKTRYNQGDVVELDAKQATRLTRQIEGLDRPPAVEEYKESKEGASTPPIRGQESGEPLVEPKAKR